MIDFFNSKFSDLIFNKVFFRDDLDTGDVYAFYCKDVFTVNPLKNVPLISYLFVSTNIYKMLVNQQKEEIAKLKKLLQEK